MDMLGPVVAVGLRSARANDGPASALYENQKGGEHYATLVQVSTTKI